MIDAWRDRNHGKGELEPWLSGAALYGDDLSAEEVAAWFEAEKEAYAELGSENRERYRYAYHAINRRLGYRYLPVKRFRCAVGIGSAYGHEFQPILPRLDRIVIVDPSIVLRDETLGSLKLEYRRARPSGELPVATAEADLVTCLGVLHHLANVSFAVREIARVLEPGGVALLREPVISMGDWRCPRPGLTARERGVPLQLLRRMTSDAGLLVERESLCFFPVASRLGRVVSGVPYDSDAIVVLDQLLSRVFSWNLRYHAVTWWHKLRPTCVFLVLRKSPA